MESMSSLVTLGMTTILLSWNSVPNIVAPTDFHLIQSTAEQCLNFDNHLEISSFLLTNKFIEKEVRSKYIDRLAELTNLGENWDGNGALPISSKVLETVKNVLLNVPAKVLDFWRIFPELNGTLLFSAKNKYVMGLSIGETEFSYVARYRDKHVSGKLPAKSEEIIKVLTELKKMIV